MMAIDSAFYGSAVSDRDLSFKIRGFRCGFGFGFIDQADGDFIHVGA